MLIWTRHIWVCGKGETYGEGQGEEYFNFKSGLTAVVDLIANQLYGYEDMGWIEKQGLGRFLPRLWSDKGPFASPPLQGSSPYYPHLEVAQEILMT